MIPSKVKKLRSLFFLNESSAMRAASQKAVLGRNCRVMAIWVCKADVYNRLFVPRRWEYTFADMRLLLTLGLALLLLAPVKGQLVPPNETGFTMGHVHLNVTDVEVNRKFWIDNLGAIPLKREGLPGVKIPGMLILFTRKAPTGGSVGTVIDHIGISVRSLAEVLKTCRAAGYEIPREFTGSEGFPNAYVTAPDNLKIELQQDTKLTTVAAAHHLHYFRAEPLVLRDWYVKTFSFVSAVRGRHQSANLPGMNLSFQPVDPQPALGTKGRVLDHIGFEVKNLEAFCKKLEASGIKLDVPYRKIPNLGIAIAFLTDPAGAYIELSEGLDAY
jgi:catechol 2,3-dioxygenase-like lactoylglutathione lyase family enzyme